MLGLLHAGVDAALDGPEVVILELLSAWGTGTDQRAPGGYQIGAERVEGTVDQEVLLLGSDARDDA